MPFRKSSFEDFYFLFLCFYFSVTELAEPSVIFTLFTEDVNWVTAKSRCEDLAQMLAVLDTEEKRTSLREQDLY